MKYLENPRFVKNKSPTNSTCATKKQIKNMAEELLDRLFPSNSGSVDVNESVSTNATTRATPDLDGATAGPAGATPEPAKPALRDTGAAGASVDPKLQRYLDGVIKKTEPKQCYELNSSIISTEMKLFEATGKRPESLTKVYECLTSINPMLHKYRRRD